MNGAAPTDQSQDAGSTDDVAILSWQSHPARERPLATVAALIVIGALAVLVSQLAEARAAGIGAAVLLCLVLHRFFFATGYEISREQIVVNTLFGSRRLSWSEVRLCAFGSRGAWLSPLSRRSWREGRRGIHILFGRQRDAVLRRIRECLPEGVVARAEEAAD